LRTKEECLFAVRPTPFDAGRLNGFETGYVYGGRVELALPTDSFLNVPRASADTLKAEYPHYSLGRRTIIDFGVGPIFGPGGPLDLGATSASRFQAEGNLVRRGINYEFETYRVGLFVSPRSDDLDGPIPCGCDGLLGACSWDAACRPERLETNAQCLGAS
jgi:hypothetical protein